jgi:hypothetical protein
VIASDAMGVTLLFFGFFSFLAAVEPVRSAGGLCSLHGLSAAEELGRCRAAGNFVGSIFYLPSFTGSLLRQGRARAKVKDQG